MLIELLISMTGFLAGSGCVDLSRLDQPLLNKEPAWATAPLPAVASRLTGTWSVEPPEAQRRDFLFLPKRYTGAHSGKAHEMFGFAACWEHLRDGKPTGEGFWGEEQDRSGDFVMYSHLSSIVYDRMGTVKVNGDRATILFEGGRKMTLRRTSTDVEKHEEKASPAKQQ
jgi:hypothetical protein